MENLLYFEDLPLGMKVSLGQFHFTEEDIVSFARSFDPQPFHVDKQAADASPFGGLIASGWHTCSALMRMQCDHLFLRSAAIGSPGVDQIRWLSPVRPGDILYGTTEVIQAHPSTFKPDRGALTLLTEPTRASHGRNQQKLYQRHARRAFAAARPCACPR